MTKHDATCILPAVPGDSSGAGAPEFDPLSPRQVAQGRELLRDWLGVGRDALTVSDSSLDKVVFLIAAVVLQKSNNPSVS